MAASVHASVEPGCVKAHERNERVRLRERACGVFPQHERQSERFVAKLAADAPRQDVDAFEARALKVAGVDFPDVPPRYRSSYFRHIWSNGYGAGYYDRTIADFRSRGGVQAVGLAYEVQEVDAVPADSHDQQLDAVVTSAGTFRFTGALA